MGYCQDNKSKLSSRYNTYYPTDVTIHNTYLVCDKILSEKLLFHKLKKYRLRTNREFFCCDLDILRNTCEEVVIIINEDNIINKNDNIIDENICLINKYKTYMNNKLQNELNKKIKKENDQNELHNKLKSIVKDFIFSECVINNDSIIRRISADESDFMGFSNYDLKITDPLFETDTILSLMN